jgi:hypothetical protein
MTPRDFISGLSEVTGLEETELMTVDKVLADRGMRGKSRGRAFHHVTTKEGIFILLGVLGSRRLLSADQVVRDLIKFSLDPGSVEAMRACQNLDQIIGLSADEVAGSTLIDVLASVASHLRSQHLLGHLKKTGGAITLRVAVDGPVLLSVDAESFDGSRQRCELSFFGSTDNQSGDARREASVSHRTLAWIGDVSDASRRAM